MEDDRAKNDSSKHAKHPSARLYVEHLFIKGYDSEDIERRLLQHQSQLDWDIPPPHPFALEGTKRETDRIRLIVSHYVDALASLQAQDLYGGVEAFTSSFEDDNLWFSQADENISSGGLQSLSPSRLREQPFDRIWKTIERMAYDIAWRFIRRESHLDAQRDLHDLVQAGRIASWECLRTYDGTTAKYSTYVHRAMSNAMSDYTDSMRPTTTASVSADEGFTDDFADATCGVLSLISALKAVKDAGLLVVQALGFRDREIDEQNVALRRFRARRKLIELLHS